MSAKRQDRGQLVGPGVARTIDAPGRTPAVLAVHGFGATPQQMGTVVEAAQSLGLRVRAPMLPGHGTHARDLARTTFADWFGAAQAAFDELTADGSPALVVGQSLGGVIAAQLTLSSPGRVLGLGLLATAIRIGKGAELTLRFLDRAHSPDFMVPKAGADIADPAARRAQLTYGENPVRAAISLVRAGMAVEARLPEITCPVFVAHGRSDHVCPVTNAARILTTIGSTDKTSLILEKSFHIITEDYDRAFLQTELTRFLGRLSR
jgi:carboxylesterase